MNNYISKTYCLVDVSLGACIPSYVKNIHSHKSASYLSRFLSILNIKCIKPNLEKNDWENECIDYDVVILFDTYRNYAYYASKIESACGNKTRLILYLWNPVSFSSDFKKISSRWEICSFSKDDSERFNFLYVETFYNPEWYLEPNDKITSDVFFIGTDKGRKSLLNDVKRELNRYHVISDIRIVDNRKALFNRSYSFYQSYQNCIKNICRTKALLEILQQGQTGLSLRCMEALFFNKKIITNNHIIKESPLYSKDRVFIIGENPWSQINDFLESPIMPFDNVILEAFSFKSFIERIINKKAFDL